MDYSKLSDQEINGLVMDAISDGNQAYRGGDGSAIKLLHQINTVEFGEHVEREEVYAKFDPCNNAADAWPIIAKHQISVCAYHRANPGMKRESWWEADIFAEFITRDDNPLRAAMIVFLKIQGSANVPVNPTGSDLR
ncbi:phage protein NinX family protein [Citrobacter freundii]|uniref:phage protein NinX family protein n=1 Tax=Citrobacter freundii TaxID=546 RepID=UPI00374E65FF